MDAFEDRLNASRLRTEEDPALRAAVDAVMAGGRGGRRNQRHYVLPAIALGLTTVFAGGAAFAVISNWSPWIVSDPDVVISRTWFDQTGKRLGFCETRISALDVPTAGAQAFIDELAGVDLDAIDPDPQTVAELLDAANRSADIDRLLPAGQSDYVESFLVYPRRPDGPLSDARILQEALTWAVTKEATLRAFESMSDSNSSVMTPQSVTQCTEEAP